MKWDFNKTCIASTVVKSESEVTQSHTALWNLVDYRLSGFLKHGISQARVSE